MSKIPTQAPLRGSQNPKIFSRLSARFLPFTILISHSFSCCPSFMHFSKQFGQMDTIITIDSFSKSNYTLKAHTESMEGSHSPPSMSPIQSTDEKHVDENLYRNQISYSTLRNTIVQSAIILTKFTELKYSTISYCSVLWR